MSHAASPQPTPPTAQPPIQPAVQSPGQGAAPAARAGEPRRFAGSNADRIAALAQFPKQARQAVAGLSAAQLDTPYRAGGWTIAQVIHHIADSHIVAFTRMKFVLAEEHPTVKPFNENVWAQQADGAGAPVEDSLLILDGLHARMARLLAAQPPSAFERGALHPERGEVTLADLLDTYAWHGPHHLEAIAKLRKDRGW
jgi:DinB superfamily